MFNYTSVRILLLLGLYYADFMQEHHLKISNIENGGIHPNDQGLCLSNNGEIRFRRAVFELCNAAY